MVVMNDVVVVMWVELLWGCWSTGLLLLVSLLLLLHEVKLVVPLAIQTFPFSLFAFPLPFALFTICSCFLSLPFASRFFAGLDPLISRDDPWSCHPSIRRF